MSKMTSVVDFGEFGRSAGRNASIDPISTLLLHSFAVFIIVEKEFLQDNDDKVVVIVFC